MSDHATIDTRRRPRLFGIEDEAPLRLTLPEPPPPTNRMEPNDPARIGPYIPPSIKSSEQIHAEWENGGRGRWIERCQRRDAKRLAEPAEPAEPTEAPTPFRLIRPDEPRTLQQLWHDWATDEALTPEQRAIRAAKLEIEAEARGWHG